MIDDLWDRDILNLAEQTLDSFPEFLPFANFGPYELAKPLGSGGMGEVFLAKDCDLSRLVAIKFLRSSWFETDTKERFTREIQTLAKLEHPFIARLYTAGIHPQGTPYLAMEYIPGTPLTTHCRERNYQLKQRLALFRSVCEAVEFAHSRLIIHLDLKPSNILVTAEGLPKLLDFGIAKELLDIEHSAPQTQSRFTPEAAAPEQIRNEPVGTYTDVFALGLILYELLCNQPPFQLEAGLAHRKFAGPPSRQPKRVNASQSEWKDLDVLCARAMQHDVDERYRSVSELAQDVDRFCSNQPLQARSRNFSFSYRAAKFLKRNRKTVLASATALLVSLGLTCFYFYRIQQARDAAIVQAQRADRTKDLLLKIIGGGYDVAPSDSLKVVDVLDRAALQARTMNREPGVQSDLYRTLASVYHNLGDLGKADPLLQSSLLARRRLYGSSSPEVGEILVALAMLRIDQAKFSEAEQFAREGMAVAKQNLPSTHLLLSESMMALGSALQHGGHFREAVEVLRQAMQMETGRPDEENIYWQTVGYLANAYLTSGQVAAAEPLERKVLEEDRRTDGPRSPGVAQDLSNISQVEIKRGFYQQAERDAREALQIDQGWYKRENIEVALIEEALAEALIYTRKYEEASTLLTSALPALQRELGNKHPFIAYGLNSKGVIALRLGNPKEAATDFQTMQEIYHVNFQGNDPHFALAELRMGQLYLSESNLPGAESSFRRAADLYGSALGRDNPQTGAARAALGDALFRERKYEKAELELQNGYSVLTKEGDSQMEPALQARNDLNEIHLVLSKSRKR